MMQARFSSDAEAVNALRDTYIKLNNEIGKVVIGQEEVVRDVVISIFSKGHCLLVGVPGLAKTLLVTTISRVLGLDYNRIQFTPDLMPSDIIGTEILDENRQFRFIKGPLFANIILADEINRTPPKTQAALLEAMQERAVTAAGKRYELGNPFFVLATQNPIEQEGTYPLPEAQLDRFMFNVVMDYLPEDDEVRVISQTTGGKPAAIEPLFTGEDVLRFHQLVRAVPVADDMVRYAVRIAAASRPRQTGTPDFINDWVSWGAGTRAAQFLVLGAKARTLLQGRAHVTVEDIQALVAPVLRHRVLLNYRAEADGMRVEEVIRRLVAAVPVPVKTA